MVDIFTCKQCDKEFLPEHEANYFCSAQCFILYRDRLKARIEADKEPEQATETNDTE